MPTSYHLASPTRGLIVPLAGTLIGALAVSVVGWNVFLPAARGEDGFRTPAPLIVAGLFTLLMLAMVAAGWHSWRGTPTALIVHDDGTIEVVRSRGCTAFAAADVEAIERHTTASKDEDGDLMVRRELRLLVAGAWQGFAYGPAAFPRAESFVAHIRALNPWVSVSGTWDIPPEAAPARRRGRRQDPRW